MEIDAIGIGFRLKVHILDNGSIQWPSGGDYFSMTISLFAPPAESGLGSGSRSEAGQPSVHTSLVITLANSLVEKTLRSSTVTILPTSHKNNKTISCDKAPVINCGRRKNTVTTDVGSNGSGSNVSLSRALLGLSSANDWCLNGSVQATADNKVRVKLIKKRSLTTIDITRNGYNSVEDQRFGDLSTTSEFTHETSTDRNQLAVAEQAPSQPTNNAGSACFNGKVDKANGETYAVARKSRNNTAGKAAAETSSGKSVPETSTTPNASATGYSLITNDSVKPILPTLVKRPQRNASKVGKTAKVGRKSSAVSVNSDNSMPRAETGVAKATSVTDHIGSIVENIMAGDVELEQAMMQQLIKQELENDFRSESDMEMLLKSSYCNTKQYYCDTKPSLIDAKTSLLYQFEESNPSFTAGIGNSYTEATTGKEVATSWENGNTTEQNLLAVKIKSEIMDDWSSSYYTLGIASHINRSDFNPSGSENSMMNNVDHESRMDTHFNANNSDSDTMITDTTSTHLATDNLHQEKLQQRSSTPDLSSSSSSQGIHEEHSLLLHSTRESVSGDYGKYLKNRASNLPARLTNSTGSGTQQGVGAFNSRQGGLAILNANQKGFKSTIQEEGELCSPEIKPKLPVTDSFDFKDDEEDMQPLHLLRRLQANHYGRNANKQQQEQEQQEQQEQQQQQQLLRFGTPGSKQGVLYSAPVLTNAIKSEKEGEGEEGESWDQLLWCDVCHHAETNYRDLLAHMKLHADITCRICRKKFKWKGNFFTHMRRHSGIKPFLCQICGKSFIWSGPFDTHMRTHTGERPFLCSTCGVSFREQSNLNRHKRIHIGEKPYICTTCGMLFARTSDVKIHKRIHTGERPYRCKTCDRAFSQSGNYHRHVRMHAYASQVDQLLGQVLSSTDEQDYVSMIMGDSNSASGYGVSGPGSSIGSGSVSIGNGV